MGAFERSSKRRKGYPSETCVKRDQQVVHGKKEAVESWDGKICVRAALGAGFKRCCLQAGRYGGSNRHYFFPELAGGPQTVKRRESEKQYLTFAFHSL
jgi:hypothetical protein